jgi:predicted O-linked N-acetylglucosamine transferase (SPINDLY family)
LAQDKPQQAINNYRALLKSNGNDFLTWLKLGDALLAQRWNPARFSISLACYRKSLELHADNPAAYHKMGNVFKRLGQQEEAMAALQKALVLDPGLIRARFSLMNIQCPILYEKEEDILSSRAAYAWQLNELCETIDLDGPEAIESAAGAVGEYPFHLGYQGYNDCSLQREYGNLICRIQAARYPQWSKPLPPSPQKTGEPLRIGIVSGFFRNHATWNFPVSGLLQAMDRKRFALYGYHTGSRCDHTTDLARQSFDRFVEDDFSLASLCDRILADKLHLLLYPEIGMNRLVVRLSSLRLAPVQCASWGHSTTSGLPTMDYFLSNDLMEPADAANHYTETLIRLPNLGVYYPPPAIETVGVERAELGLKKDAVLYLCLQSLFKYLPQYDEVFPRIAQKAGNCQFVFMTGRLSKPVVNILRRRLADVFSRNGLKSEDYIVFFPYLDDKHYFSLHRSGDVFLDSIGWSGCNTTMDAIARHLPVVTLPGAMMRARQSMALLKMMNVTDTVAESVADYVRIAARLGTDRHWRKQIEYRMAANKHKLYADKTAVEYLELFFERAVAEALRQWDQRTI